MEKNDELLFGKFKGSTWAILLDSEEGTQWGDWWSTTHSKGPYKNKENQMKNVWRGWRGLEPVDTRNQIVGFDAQELYRRLDVIEGKLDTLLNKESPEEEIWAHE